MNEAAELLLKEALERHLRAYLGPLDEKPIPELRAWALALLDLARECRELQLDLEDLLHNKRFAEKDLPLKFDPSFPYPEIHIGPNAPE